MLVNLACATLSKAFEKSRMAISVCSLLSVALTRSFVVKLCYSNLQWPLQPLHKVTIGNILAKVNIGIKLYNHAMF